jgi:SET and MYND domain-containing protein
MCLDLTLASCNHSCDPNTAVLYDGPRISLRSVRAVPAGAELHLCYVRPSDPFRRRQQQLRQRFFFVCACTKCQHGPTLSEDRFLPRANSADDNNNNNKNNNNSHRIGDNDWTTVETKLPMTSQRNPEEPAKLEREKLEELEDRCFTLLERADAADVPSATAIHLLSEAAAALRASAVWPVHRQPWPAINQSLAIAYLRHDDTGSGRGWTRGIRLLVRAHFRIDPVLYPERWHPARVVNAFALATFLLASGGGGGSSSSRSTGTVVAGGKPKDDAAAHALARYGFDVRVIAWRLVVGEIVPCLRMSHGTQGAFVVAVETLAHVLHQDMQQLHGGGLPKSENVDAQWVKLQAFADEEDDDNVNKWAE